MSKRLSNKAKQIGTALYSKSKKKQPKLIDTKTPKQETSSNIPKCISSTKDGSVRISFHAKPGAKHNAIVAIGDQEIDVSIAAPPRDGEANEELREFVAKVLQIRKGAVNLVRGQTSRNKVVEVEDISAQSAYKRLLEAQKS